MQKAMISGLRWRPKGIHASASRTVEDLAPVAAT